MVRFRVGVCVSLAIGLLSAPAIALAQDQPDRITADELQEAVDERAAFGLQSDLAFVQTMLEADRAAGASSDGLPFSANELAAIDLPERARFADRADKAVRPIATKLPGYAGVYQDQKNGGRIVVLFTDVAAEAKSEVIAAAGDAPVTVRSGLRSTLAELQSASDRLLTERARLLPDVAVLSVAIDEAGNRLEVGVPSAALSEATAETATLSGAIGVDVSFTAASPAVDEAQQCDGAGRNHCFDPMRAGTLVHNAAPAASVCTMGYHVQKTTSTATKGFLLSGHCGYGGSTNWYMNRYIGAVGNGFIGSRQATLYRDQGYDCQVIKLPTIQASRQIYDTTRAVSGSGLPVQGEALVISPGQTDEDLNSGNDAGTVANANFSYVNDRGFIIRAADGNGWSTRPGDSGSPIYREVGAGAVAVGVHSTSQGYFARVTDCLSLMAYSVQ